MLTGSTAQAEPVNVTLAELGTAIDALTNEPDALQRLVLEKIESEIAAADLTFTAGELLFTSTASNLSPDSACNRTEVREVKTNIRLVSDTGVSLSLESINDPIRLAITLDAQLSAHGRARQVYGFRLDGCRTVGTDSFNFNASSSAQLFLQLELRLNPILDTARRRLNLRPVVALTGSLTRQEIRVDVEDSILRNLLERLLEDEIGDVLDQREVVRAVTQLGSDLARRLDTRLDNGVLSVDLPDPSDAQINELYRLLSPQGDFSLSLGYLRSRRLELLAALILGDKARAEELVSDTAQCEAAGLFQVPLAHQSVYAIDETGCAPVQIPQMSTTDATGQTIPLQENTRWYVDPACQLVVDYQMSNIMDFCTVALDTTRLGNAASRADELGRWTLSPSTRFDIGAVPLAGKFQPFTHRLNYKSVATEMGECQLEMRVHSPMPFDQYGVDEAGSTGLRPLIAFHGGTWQGRFSGALGLEAFATSLVHQGFVVFEPFYRLIGDSEGNAECNNATLSEVLVDAHDAMSWVLQNSFRYGASGKPVLFGQSAGGQIAGLLAVERASEIAAAGLFYAPVDFSDYIQRWDNGAIDTEAGRRVLEAVLGESIAGLEVQTLLQKPVVLRNSLPARIATDFMSSTFPPIFLLQGQADMILPYQQSVRLCNALAGRNIDAQLPASEGGDALRQVLDCGNSGSQLHLMREGEHALDLCIADELCLAGSPASAALTRDSVEQMLDWMTRAPSLAQDDDGSAAGSRVGETAADPFGEFTRDEGTVNTPGNGGGSLSFPVLMGFFCMTVLARGRQRWQ